MKVVLTGLPQSGQQQLFSILTKIPLDTISQKPLEVQKGICDVVDPRVVNLIKMYNPKKKTFAKIEYSLLPDFNLQGPAKQTLFNELKNSDVICWVCRGENAESDISSFISELVIFDLMLLEKRLETLEKELKKKSIEPKEKEKKFLLRCKQALDEGKMLNNIAQNTEEEISIRTYQFLTAKPLVCAVNLPEGEKLEKDLGVNAIGVSIEIEEEINRLEEKDREAFIKEMGIDEPALQKMTRTVFSSLGLISFFTVGEDEVRAWPVRKNSTAPEAASTIHSDIAKGFVRAEMFKYTDLVELGSEAKLKESGKFNLKGRDYVVEDGDILSFRFNV